MPITSSDILSFAIHSKSLNTEVGYRNSTARAYYAMFHHVQESLVSCPKFVGGTHQGLADYLNKANPTEPYDKTYLRRLAAILNQQKGLRNIADYELEQTFFVTDAQASLDAAHRLFKLSQEMRDSIKSEAS
ncbi:hypothetical protein [Aeromonas veronii]|uniref:hypothetical protein n=1 Tax=Aeromonas veronii TaxID=654 RepID=UPI002B48CE5E|nr:hypothetical protein [Aeromonas veronii]